MLPSYNAKVIPVRDTHIRVLACIQALLAQIEFESRDKAWAARMVRVLYGFEVSGLTDSERVIFSAVGA